MIKRTPFQESKRLPFCTTSAGPEGKQQWDLSPEQFKKSLVLLFLFGLIIRVGFFIEHSHLASFGVLTLDQKYYDAVAKMLRMGIDLHELRGFRPLLYPMFLAALYKIGGAWGIPLTIAVQHLLGVATGLLAALIGSRLFGLRLAGLLGGILFLLAPVPLYFEGEVLIEPSYTFLIYTALLVHFWAADCTGYKSALLWFLAGALISLAAQARPNILIFLAVYPLLAAWLCCCRSRGAASVAPLVGLAGAFAMAVLWGFVNLKQADHFHLLPNAGGINLYVGNRRGADGVTPAQARRVSYGERYQDPVEVWALEEYQAAMAAKGRAPETDPAAISSYWVHRTLDEIQAAPVQWLRLMFRKCWLTVWNTEIPNNKAFAFLQQESIWLRLLPVRWVVLFALMPLGIWAAFKRAERLPLLIVLIFISFYLAGNLAFTPCDRYRYPVWPAMAALAGGGLLAFIRTLQLRDARAAMVMTSSMVLMMGICLPNWCGVRLPSFARDYLFRSIAWYEKGRLPEALSDVERSVDLDPSDPTALQQRGNVLAGLNRLADARASFEAALKLSPEESPTWNNLGAIYEQLGDTNSALRAFGMAIKCKSPSRNAFLSLACLQLRVGDYKEAEITLDQLEQQNRGLDAPLLAIRSVLARRLGDPDQANKFEAEARALDANAADWVLGRIGKE
jgi:Tfp pilus assembly protein PilF